jgi:hypothetical protein
MPTLNWKASARWRGFVARNGRGSAPPTLFTTMSSRPNSATAAAGSPATASRSVRSAGTTSARRPAAATSWATLASWSSARAEISTSAPASASATAMAAPIPPPAPVTTATWPVTRRGRGRRSPDVDGQRVTLAAGSHGANPGRRPGGCTGIGPKSSASRTPAHCGVGLGAANRPEPQGAAAYGMPRKAVTPSAATAPRTRPPVVGTTRDSVLASPGTYRPAGDQRNISSSQDRQASVVLSRSISAPNRWWLRPTGMPNAFRPKKRYRPSALRTPMKCGVA